MKSLAIGIVLFVVLALSSCGKCVDCKNVSGVPTTETICKEDYETKYKNNAVSWEKFRSALKASGCK